MKKALIMLIIIMSLLSLVAAKSINIEFPNNDNEFEAGMPITFTATLYDDQGNRIDGQIQVTIEDSKKIAIINQDVPSGQIATINLGEKASSGQGIITAVTEDATAIAFFYIGVQEQVIFEIQGNILKVTNSGNTPYLKTIQITIGETTGTQEVNLEIGESTTYRLIAPNGVYNVKVTDGKTTITRGNVQLTGTGQAIGAIDETPSQRTGITGVTSPNEGSDMALLGYLKRSKFVYVFIAVIFGAMILIAIERNYRKKR